jgi:hypothetical protein
VGTSGNVTTIWGKSTGHQWIFKGMQLAGRMISELSPVFFEEGAMGHDDMRQSETDEERRNRELVREYIEIAYDPKCASA